MRRIVISSYRTFYLSSNWNHSFPFSSNKHEGLQSLQRKKKKKKHMQYPCATIKAELAIQQNESCFMDSGSKMKCSLVIFLRSIRTSCDVRLKLVDLRQGL